MMPPLDIDMRGGASEEHCNVTNEPFSDASLEHEGRTEEPEVENVNKLEPADKAAVKVEKGVKEETADKDRTEEPEVGKVVKKEPADEDRTKKPEVKNVIKEEPRDKADIEVEKGVKEETADKDRTKEPEVGKVVKKEPADEADVEFAITIGLLGTKVKVQLCL